MVVSILVQIGAVVWRCAEAPAASPVVKFGSKGVDRAHLVVQMAVDGHGLAALPPLNGGDVAFEVCRDFLPGIEAVVDGSF